MRRTLLALFTLLCLALTPLAFAGVHYTAVTTTEGDGVDQRTRVEGWVEGESAKVVFTESGSPGMEKGQYIVTKDGGKTLFLVDPSEKSYAEWDLEAMMATLGNMMESLGPIVNFQIDNVEVQELGDEAGPELLGLPTRHHTFRTTYDMKIKVMGMGRTNRVESDQEVWSTTALDHDAMTVLLRNAPTTGFGELDELVRAEMGKVRGFPLKSVTRSTTTGQKGKRSSTTVMTTEVTELDASANVAASTFEIPEDYTRNESLVPAEDGEGEEDQGNPFGKIFGRG